MIELQMVYRMAKRGAIVAPFVVAPFFIWGGWDAGLSAAIGIAQVLRADHDVAAEVHQRDRAAVVGGEGMSEALRDYLLRRFRAVYS
mgnify:CR=1 FL=1